MRHIGTATAVVLLLAAAAGAATMSRTSRDDLDRRLVERLRGVNVEASTRWSEAAASEGRPVPT